MTSQPLGSEAEVFRLVSHNDEHFPRDAPKPHPDAFRLTSADLDEGAQRGEPPVLSVFDFAKTTTAEGRAIRRAQAAAVGRIVPEMTPFGLRVASVRALQVPPGLSPLDVVSDPLDPKWGPGSNGHAGICGLDGKRGTPDLKNKLRLIRSALRDACYRVDDA